MSQFQNHSVENMGEGYYDDNPVEFEDTGSHKIADDESLDSDSEDDLELNIQKTDDTSALEVRNGKDIQGIPWDRLFFTREDYRESRLKQYRNFENLSISREGIEKEYKKVEKGHCFYDFQFNTRMVKSTIVHFQLRNLLWATSKNDVYLMQNQSVMHWSSILRRSKELLDVAKPIVSQVKYPGSYGQTLSNVQISSMSIKDNMLVAGGFHGEFICKHLNKPGVAFSTKLSTDEDAITNSVDICNINGSLKIMAANNDAQVRVFDAGNFVRLNHFNFPWSVNNTSVSPDGKQLAILGDSSECLIADAVSGKVIGNLKGHLDYSFASTWHPDGRILATGNQDTTCRLWDMRKTSEAVSVLKGRMGAIRAIRFTSDGRFMAMAEPADFIHIFDTQCDYTKAQEIDLFGEIGGISFSPDTEALFVGIADRTYGSLLEFNMRHRNHYLDSVF